jgi:peptide/nickel transport system permease protein
MSTQVNVETRPTPAVAPNKRRFGQRVRPILRFSRRRLLHAVIVLFIVSLFTTLLVDMVPGDPATVLLGENANPESVELARERLGLNKPLAERYVEWAGNAVTGDLGTSLRTNEHVTDAIKQRLPVTLQLTLMAQVFALAMCFPLAMLMASRAGRKVDRIAESILSVVIATPSFVLGVVLIYFVGIKWDLLPILGWIPLTEDLTENLRRAVLPALTIALLELAAYTRLLRGDLITTFQEDYILAARSKGLTSRRVLFGHALRPSLFTLVTYSGLSFARLLGGTVIVESMFTLPGLGRLAVDAVKYGDLVMVQGIAIFIALVYLVINLLVDVAYGWLDPRARERRAK